MKPFIFGKHNAKHIINVKETVKGLIRAKRYLSKLVADGKDVLFVGTKQQAQIAVMATAERTTMHYCTERWLGGTLSNYRTIRSRLAKLEELEKQETDGFPLAGSKKAESMMKRELRKIRRNLSGLRKMDRMPGCLVVIDPKREDIAIKEARKLGIPTVCLVDTDSNPDSADIVIPGNDDSMRSIELVLRELGDAIEEGKAGRPTRDEPVATPRSTRQDRQRSRMPMGRGGARADSRFEGRGDGRANRTDRPDTGIPAGAAAPAGVIAANPGAAAPMAVTPETPAAPAN